MTTLRTAAQQALEALDEAKNYTNCKAYSPTLTWECEEAITALKAALAEPVQEPVAWTLTKTLDKRETTTNGYLWFSDPQNSSWTPLYTAPPQRKPLSEDEIQAIWSKTFESGSSANTFARAIERAHGIE